MEEARGGGRGGDRGGDATRWGARGCDELPEMGEGKGQFTDPWRGSMWAARSMVARDGMRWKRKEEAMRCECDASGCVALRFKQARMRWEARRRAPTHGGHARGKVDGGSGAERLAVQNDLIRAQVQRLLHPRVHRRAVCPNKRAARQPSEETTASGVGRCTGAGPCCESVKGEQSVVFSGSRLQHLCTGLARQVRRPPCRILEAEHRHQPGLHMVNTWHSSTGLPV
eukprot:804995-Rhodomonas_salina.1